MFILYALVLGLGAGLVSGGRLERLGTVHLQWAAVAIGGLLVQLFVFSPAGSGLTSEASSVLYVGSTIAVLVVVLRNIRLAGLPMVALGASLNLAAIVANGGRMPADPGALAMAGRNAPGFATPTPTDGPALAPLTDIFAIPAGIPLANVFSIGDVLIGVGIAVALISLMHSAVPRSPKSAVRGSDGRAQHERY